MWDYAGLKLGVESNDLDAASKRSKAFLKDVNELESATMRLAKVAGVALGSLAAAFSVRALANYADAWSDMQSRIGAAVKDMDAAPELMRRMVDIANASYAPLNQTVETYARNVQVLADLGYTADQTADFTESLNHMLVITATKGERAASVQNALSKAMAVGKLQAEGLEAVLTNGGRAAEALAKELGTTVAGLRAAASEGRITGDVIAKALIGNLEEVREQAGEMPATIADGFVRIQTGIQAFVGQLDQAMGTSGSFANFLVSIGDAIKTIAMVDFGSVLNEITDGFVLLTQAAGVLAAMLLTKLVSSFIATTAAMAAASGAGVVMTAQFVAGAAASRLMAVAMAAQAGAARTLATALAFVGGPIGLVIGGIAALGFAVYNHNARYRDWAEATESVTEAQKRLNEAMEAFEKLRTADTVKTAMDEAEQTVAAIRAEVAALEEASASRERWDKILYLGLDTSRGDEVRAALVAANGELIAAEAKLSALQLAWEGIATKTAEAKGEVIALTAEQQQAQATAYDMLLTTERRIELARLENAYGKESVGYKLREFTHERDIYFAKVASLDVTNKIKDALRRSWMEEQQATGKTREWDAAMDILKDTSQKALDIVKTIGETEPGSTWLDTAISKAAKLAGVLWSAAEGLGELSALELDAAGNPVISGTKGKRPREKPIDIDFGIPDATGGGGGGGGGGADPMAERYKQLEESFRSEIALSTKHYQEDLEALQWALGAKKLAHEEYQLYLEMLRINTWGAEWEQQALQYQMDQEALQAALDQKLISYEDYYRKLKELSFANLMSDHNRSDLAQDLSNWGDYFGKMNTIAGGGFDGLLKLQRAFGAASALINAWQGYSEALANNPMMPPWMKLMWAGKILAAGLGAVSAIKGGGKGSAGSGGGAATAASAATSQPEPPLRVTLDAIDPDASYTGASIQRTFDAIQKEAGDRGIIWTTAGELG